MGAAKDVAAGLSEREASHIAFFDLLFTGRTDAAIAALYAHLTAWPRDALVVASGANPNGLIGGSGRIGGWAARAGPGEDRAIPGREPEQRARRAWLRPCLLRE